MFRHTMPASLAWVDEDMFERIENGLNRLLVCNAISNIHHVLEPFQSRLEFLVKTILRMNTQRVEHWRGGRARNPQTVMMNVHQ